LRGGGEKVLVDKVAPRKATKTLGGGNNPSAQKGFGRRKGKHLPGEGSVGFWQTGEEVSKWNRMFGE